MRSGSGVGLFFLLLKSENMSEVVRYYDGNYRYETQRIIFFNVSLVIVFIWNMDRLEVVLQRVLKFPYRRETSNPVPMHTWDK